jgi:hypothetical protein
MATEAQINANRANAKSSTGPKSPEGLESPLGVRAKEKSSANATKFGLFSKCRSSGRSLREQDLTGRRTRTVARITSGQTFWDPRVEIGLLPAER